MDFNRVYLCPDRVSPRDPIVLYDIMDLFHRQRTAQFIRIIEGGDRGSADHGLSAEIKGVPPQSASQFYTHFCAFRMDRVPQQRPALHLLIRSRRRHIADPGVRLICDILGLYNDQSDSASCPCPVIFDHPGTERAIPIIRKGSHRGHDHPIPEIHSFQMIS